MHKRWMAALLFLIISSCTEAYEQDLLKTADISRIMEQILSEHVDKKEVNIQILHHAFETYIDQFDPHRMYLLESEVLPYFKPNSALLEQAVQGYKRQDFNQFKQLNQVIQKSIERARQMRQDLESSIKNSFSHPIPDKGHAPIANKEELASFAKTKEQLKERMLENLGTYIDLQKKRYGDSITPERKEQILRSYEIKLREFENQYLYQNEKGQPLPPAEQESLFTLHVLKALASSLDSHTSFYKADEAYDIRVRLQKEFKGIGLVLKDTIIRVS